MTENEIPVVLGTVQTCSERECLCPKAGLIKFDKREIQKVKGAEYTSRVAANILLIL